MYNMKSNLSRQQNAMISLAKPKFKTAIPDKQKTWSNILNKKSDNVNTAAAVLKKKPIKISTNIDKTNKTINKGIQCDSPKILHSTKLCKSSNSLSIFNPIRTLQFLLKEIVGLPNTEDITKIVNEMQVVVERMINECSENVPYSKLDVPVLNDNYMIPTKENDYSNLKYENNPQENKYWLVLLEKISELETSYSQLTKNCTKSEEKLLNVISERDKLLEKFKESCDLMEKLNNREREYINIIAELRTKLMASEKLVSKQESIIINLNEKINNSPNKNKGKKLTNGKISTEQYNTYKSVLKENYEFEQNCNNKPSLDKLKITNYYNDNEVSKLRSDIKQMKQIVLSGLENIDIKSTSMTSLKSESKLKDLSKYNKANKINIENDIDTQYNEYNRQASALKKAKTELQQLFETIKTQANYSKQLFNSTAVDNEINLSEISDEEDKHSNVSNFMSVGTNSSC